MQDLEERLQSYEPLWGQWRLEERLYSGDASAVYEISRQRLDKPLRSIVKLLHMQGTTEEQDAFLSSAINEIECMELLQGSPYIVSYRGDAFYPCVDSSGKVYGYDVLIRMDYLRCLSDEIREGRSFSEKEVVDLGRQICAALSAAHGKGIMHLDIKPANIYLREDGRCLLGGFDSSAAQRKSEIFKTMAGAAAYVAPELLRDEYDQRADFYSLGLVLYQLLNENFLPFIHGDSTYSQREEAIRKRHRGEAVIAPKNGSRRLKKTVLKALSFAPGKRFSSAYEMRFSLEGRHHQKKKSSWR
ncbi:MAG: serine/threonine-protein kinase [Bacillota bacterium]|nr:serine/threonine-protein kinase [Bacillota bacterium]